MKLLELFILRNSLDTETRALVIKTVTAFIAAVICLLVLLVEIGLHIADVHDDFFIMDCAVFGLSYCAGFIVAAYKRL